eukprot:TRINITY_DN6291_c0_g1_i2.p1 TRINITY_DN6291_c0_g1~~TRINITY_DN6291_c0_g1_i2.p1  ORF type:complete len:411 (-),score=118.16 TRINITY_DN6291_c0_g1_i2:95-1327(-)
MSVKLLFNEFVAINQDRKGIYKNQAKIDFPDGPENAFCIDIILTPVEGMYEGSRVVFNMRLPENYPQSPPTLVSCKTKIFHPNVTFDGRVCFNMFSGEWNASYRLEQFVNGLLWLLANPNPESALNGAAADRNLEKLATNVRLAMKGMTINGTTFEPFINTDSADPKFLDSMRLTFEDILRYAKAKLRDPTGHITLSEVLQGSPQMAAILPLNDIAFDLAQKMNITILKGSHKRIHGASTRSRVFNFEKKNIIKELVFLVDGAPILVIAAGGAPIDLDRLANELKIDRNLITLPKRTSIKEITGYEDVSHISSFGFKANVFKQVFVSELVNTEDLVLTASMVAGLYLKMRGVDLIASIGSCIVISNLQLQATPNVLLTEITPKIPQGIEDTTGDVQSMMTAIESIAITQA